MQGQIEGKKVISEFVERGVVDKSVLDELWTGSGYLLECELWDFKAKLPTCSTSWAKLVKHCVAFHNTYGGYILFGLKEDRNSEEYVLESIEPPPRFNEELRSTIGKYCSPKFDVHFRSVERDGETLGVLHVPKRTDDKPVSTKKTGPPEKEGSNRPVFAKDVAFLRSSDESVPAKTAEDFGVLFSARPLGLKNEIINDDPIGFVNRPDRSIICPVFFGRDDIIERLWYWMADDFSAVKVLAGEGGKGKTSVAFEFARQFSRNSPSSFEQVIWLSAKKKKFSGLKNDWLPMPEWHFEDFPSLVRGLAEHLPVEPDEDLTIDELKKEIRECFRQFPSLVVVDDVDSLEKEEQKRALELGLAVAQNSKFLFTTRHNTTYSSDIALEVPGLALADFRALVRHEEQKFGAKLSDTEIKGLHKRTDGSPLLCESILRWIKLGNPFSQALKRWEGEDGEIARSAVLSKELEGLSVEARRLLLILSILGEASLSELGHVAEVDQSIVERSVDELGNLFMLAGRRITEEESRFAVSNNVRMLALERHSELAHDFRRIEARAKEMSSSSVTRGNSGRIGRAISQATAQLRSGDVEAARRTTLEELGRQDNHPDLLVMLGICALASEEASALQDARQIFEKAYRAGQRKEALFEKWYSAELEASYGLGLKDVAQKALQSRLCDAARWQYKLGQACVFQADLSKRGANKSSEFQELEEASRAFAQSISEAGKAVTSKQIEWARATNDRLMELQLARSGRDVDFVSLLITIIESGDRRTHLYRRIVDSIVSLVGYAHEERYQRRLRGQANVCLRLIEDAKRNDHRGVMAHRLSWREALQSTGLL